MKRKKRVSIPFYLFRNSLESRQKSEYPFCKIIASQNNLPVNRKKFQTKHDSEATANSVSKTLFS